MSEQKQSPRVKPEADSSPEWSLRCDWRGRHRNRRRRGCANIQTGKRIEKQREQFARELGVKPSDITTKKLKTLTALAKSAKQNDALFYEALKIGVAYGKYKNFNQWREENRKLDTEKARSEFVTETIKFANKKIRESNKQRALTGANPLPVLRRSKLKAEAKRTAKSRARKVIGK